MIFTHFFVSHEEADLSNYEWLVVMKTTSVVPAIFPKAMAYAATQMGSSSCVWPFAYHQLAVILSDKMHVRIPCVWFTLPHVPVIHFLYLQSSQRPQCLSPYLDTLL